MNDCIKQGLSPWMDKASGRNAIGGSLRGWEMCEEYCEYCRIQRTCSDGLLARIAVNKERVSDRKLPKRNKSTRKTIETPTSRLSLNSNQDSFVHFSDVRHYIKEYRKGKNGNHVDVRTPTPRVNTPPQRKETLSTLCSIPAYSVDEKELMDLSKLKLATVRVLETPVDQYTIRRKTQNKYKEMNKNIRTIFKRNEATQKFRWLSGKPCAFTTVPTLTKNIKTNVNNFNRNRQFSTSA